MTKYEKVFGDKTFNYSLLEDYIKFAEPFKDIKITQKEKQKHYDTFKSFLQSGLDHVHSVDAKYLPECIKAIDLTIKILQDLSIGTKLIANKNDILKYFYKLVSKVVACKQVNTFSFLE